MYRDVSNLAIIHVGMGRLTYNLCISHNIKYIVLYLEGYTYRRSDLFHNINISLLCKKGQGHSVQVQ